MGRAQERRASHGKGRYYPGMWEDILATWECNRKVFHWGVGQSTLAWAVRCATGRRYPSHHIRKQLIYAINAGFVRYIRPDEKIDGRTGKQCTRFMLIKAGPLPKPGEPLVSNVADIIESNGKTIRENNRAVEHKIPLKTLVALVRTDEDKSCGCMEDHDGIRAYVVQHQRDCDRTPLYGLALSRDHMKDDLIGTPYEKLVTMGIEGGFSDQCLRVIDASDEWPRVPPKGTYVIADHPITVINPSLIFCVSDIKTDLGKIWVRGEQTCWFEVRSIRPPTPEEAANMANYHPSEL